MEFLAISGYNVKAGKVRAFQKWVRDNIEALGDSMPAGTELVGIYATMFSTEKEAGSFRTVMRLDSYGAMDTFAAAAAEESEFARLLDEMVSFGVVRIGAGVSSELLKSVADITIWADAPEE